MEYPTGALLRINQIIGNPRANPPIPPLIPVSRSAWWAGVKSGRFPSSIKLSPGVTVWKYEDVLAVRHAAPPQKAVIRQPETSGQN